MNLYAIHDRLINYFMVPFSAPGDKEATAAIANHINGDTIDAISQAPHHFEIYRLGSVEEGHLIPNREFIADCASLVRRSVRQADNGTSRNPDGTHSRGAGEAPRAAIDTRTEDRPVSGATPPEDRQAPTPGERPPGSLKD